MEKLSEAQLWAKISKLKGQHVRTIAQGRKNQILDVLDDKVIRISSTSSKPSPVPRRHFHNTYDYLWEHGHVTHSHFDKPDFPENPVGKRVSRIVLAILASAVPEQVEPFPRKGHQQSGIRLKTRP